MGIVKKDIVKFVICALIYDMCRDTGAVSDRSDVIFEVPKCSKILIFRGSAPDPLGELTGRAYVAPQTS